MTDARQIADRLRDARERAGLSTDELEDLAGLERGAVEAYELTLRRPSRSTLQDLARALRVPPTELVQGQ